MIGYVLLISIAIIISIFVYQWLRTYVPTEEIKCDDGVSVFVKSTEYNCTTNPNTLVLTVKNTGRFNVAGYYIHATNIVGQKVATINLSDSTPKGLGKNGVVLWSLTNNENNIAQGDEMHDVFDLSTAVTGTIYSIEVIPLRYQTVNNRIRAVSCGNAFVREDINCA